jgi:hypothetical protein
MAKKEKMVFNDDREPGSSGGDRGTDDPAPNFLNYENSNFRGGGDKNGGLMKSKKMASGGSASSRADGIAIKGKTRGKMC